MFFSVFVVILKRQNMGKCACIVETYCLCFFFFSSHTLSVPYHSGMEMNMCKCSTQHCTNLPSISLQSVAYHDGNASLEFYFKWL